MLNNMLSASGEKYKFRKITLLGTSNTISIPIKILCGIFVFPGKLTDFRIKRKKGFSYG